MLWWPHFAIPKVNSYSHEWFGKNSHEVAKKPPVSWQKYSPTSPLLDFLFLFSGSVQLDLSFTFLISARAHTRLHLKKKFSKLLELVSRWGVKIFQTNILVTNTETNQLDGRKTAVQDWMSTLLQICEHNLRKPLFTSSSPLNCEEYWWTTCSAFGTGKKFHRKKKTFSWWCGPHWRSHPLGKFEWRAVEGLVSTVVYRTRMWNECWWRGGPNEGL